MTTTNESVLDVLALDWQELRGLVEGVARKYASGVSHDTTLRSPCSPWITSGVMRCGREPSEGAREEAELTGKTLDGVWHCDGSALQDAVQDALAKAWTRVRDFDDDCEDLEKKAVNTARWLVRQWNIFPGTYIGTKGSTAGKRTSATYQVRTMSMDDDGVREEVSAKAAPAIGALDAVDPQVLAEVLASLSATVRRNCLRIMRWTTESGLPATHDDCPVDRKDAWRAMRAVKAALVARR